MNQETHPDDICVWPDGSYCDRRDLLEMPWKGDDYKVLYVDTPEWEGFDCSAPEKSL